MADEKRPLLRRLSVRDDRPLSQRRLACVTILLSELLERLSFYGVSFNLVLFLNHEPFSWASVDASNAQFIFQGFSFGFSFFAGYIADAHVGRFRTILLFGVFLAVGYTLLFFGSMHGQFGGLPSICFAGNKSNYPEPSVRPWSDLSPAMRNVGNWTPFISPTSMTDVGDTPCQPVIFIALLCIAIGTAAFRTNVAPFGADQVS